MTWKSMRLCTSIASNLSSPHRKAGRILVLVLVVSILPALARASSVNFSPAFDHATEVNRSAVVANAAATSTPLNVNKPTGCGSSYSCTAVTALNFMVALSAASQATQHFTNMSGVAWTSLTFTETGVAASNIACSSNLFSCSVMPNGANGARIVLTAFGTLIGVPAGQSFELGFGCKSGGCAAWPTLTLTADANLVPEPNTAMLALTGFGLIGGAFILWRRKHTFSA